MLNARKLCAAWESQTNDGLVQVNALIKYFLACLQYCRFEIDDAARHLWRDLRRKGSVSSRSNNNFLGRILPGPNFKSSWKLATSTQQAISPSAV